MWGKVVPRVTFKSHRLKAKWDCSTHSETVYVYSYKKRDIFECICYLTIHISKHVPVIRCHSRSSSLPACRLWSHHLLHFWNASWKSFSIRVSSTLCDSVCVSSMVSNRRPFSFNFIFENRKNSQGAKSGEYSGWGMTAILFFARNFWVRTDMWEGALSWWSSQVCSRQNLGWCLRSFSRSRHKMSQ